jgi:hypothetical protein
VTTLLFKVLVEGHARGYHTSDQLQFLLNIEGSGYDESDDVLLAAMHHRHDYETVGFMEHGTWNGLCNVKR